MNKINYQKELEKTLENITKSDIKPSLLLHVCCAPCSSYVLEYLNKYLKTILYTFFTFIEGKTFEQLEMWVDLFFVSMWMLVDEKENINIENKKETIPSLIGIVLGLLLQYFI